MIKKPRCQKAQTKQGKMALYCAGEMLCAHQYYCPQTKQYENVSGFQTCHRLQPSKPAEVVQPIVTENSYVPVHRYTQNVVPTDPVETKTTTSEGSQENGRVRNTKRRGRKKG